jgi:diguanylate cyclase (GGDEF)-like protein
MPDDEDEDDLLKTGEVPALPMDPHATTERPPLSAPSLDAAPVTTKAVQGAAPSTPSSSRDSWRAVEMGLDRTTEKTIAVPSKVKNDRATLTVLNGFNAGEVFALDEREHILGRGTEADLWAEDPAVSRKHARITHTPDGEYVLEDLKSTNGTFVAARRAERCELASGDRIQLGPNLLLRFAIVDDAEEEMQRRLYESSTRDSLTRAYNRKYLGERLIAEIAHAERHKTELSLLMLDLDDFKLANDTYGHLAGDMVLRVVAAQMMRLIRVEDVLARYGGEEFVILVRSTNHAAAVRLAERTRGSIEQLTIPIKDAKLSVTVSVGVASLAELGEQAGPTELVALADARLYRAKMAGRNRVCSEG